MNSPKQSLSDFTKEHWQTFGKIGCIVKMDEYREVLTVKYPSGFTYELRGVDFPNRNLIPICGKNSKGTPVILGYEHGSDTTPSLSLQRFLESGERRYVPRRSSGSSSSFVNKFVRQGVEA